MKRIIFTGLLGLFLTSHVISQILFNPFIRQTSNSVDADDYTTSRKAAMVTKELVWERVYKLPAQQIGWQLIVVDEKTIWAYSEAFWWLTPPVKEQYLYRSIDGGSKWQKIKAPGDLSFTAIDSLNVWASVGGVGIMKTTNAGKTWDTLLKIDRYGPVHFFNKNDGIFIGGYNNNEIIDAGDSITIYTTINGGVDWAKINSTKYSGTLNGESIFTTNDDGLYYRGDSVLFITNKGRVFSSIDKGSTWSVKYSLFGENEMLNGIIANGSTDQTILSIGKTTGIGTYEYSAYPKIISTHDAGNSWERNECLSLSVPCCISSVPGSDSISFIGAYKYSYGSGGTAISTDYGVTYVLIDSASNPILMQFLNYNTGFAISFNENDSRSSTENYILKWKPGVYKEKQYWLTNKKLPESCIKVNVTNNKKVEFSMFPNPVNGILNITIPKIPTSYGSIQLFDYTGRQVLSTTLSAIKQGETITVNVSNQPIGVYLLRLRAGKEEYSGKVVLVK